MCVAETVVSNYNYYHYHCYFSITFTMMDESEIKKKKVDFFHYDGKITSKIRGCLAYYSCVDKTLFALKMLFGIMMLFWLCVGLLRFIGRCWKAGMPKYVMFYHEIIAGATNNTTINPLYDSCYVENEIKHCYVYEEISDVVTGISSIAGIVTNLFLTFLFPLFSVIVKPQFEVDFMLAKLMQNTTFLVTIFVVDVIAICFWLHFAELSDIHFYTKIPSHFENIVFACEKSDKNKYEIICKNYGMEYQWNIVGYSAFTTWLIEVALTLSIITFQILWKNYEKHRELVKKEVQDGIAECV